MKRITITLSDDILSLIDSVTADSLSAENRSQFIRKALVFYLNENYHEKTMEMFSRKK